MKTEQDGLQGAEHSDEWCMRALSLQQQEGLQPLFARYARFVFHIASESLGSEAAEDIVQDVFLTVWRKADTFDPHRGAFRPWLMQITHHRILNELRTRSRRPALDAESAVDGVESMPDFRSEPAEVAWQSYRRGAVRAAIERLPQSQRQALSLAFFEDLSHDQVAATLNLPLGTVKARIRAGLGKLRFILAPLGVAAVAVAVLVGFGLRAQAGRVIGQRNERALSMVTASDITTLHIPAAPGVSGGVHGSYRGRPSTPLAVLALHDLPSAPAGRTYQGWARSNGTWISMGTALSDSQGNALLVAENPALATFPQTVEVTVEPIGGSRLPTGPAVVLWEARERGK
jgi:RNA polymerase sigma-70 factor (ECF subfamily)